MTVDGWLNLFLITEHINLVETRLIASLQALFFRQQSTVNSQQSPVNSQQSTVTSQQSTVTSQQRIFPS
ncbi:MAG: hypothetical protein KME64_29155 [Scytonematopsis contorta HA4267-MV1]|nr:hypothetical protein [Scytonematopsis contorta HA4267-MV1]